MKGLLWFDDDPDKTTADKIKDGARRYYRKFREVPNLVKINPAAGAPVVTGLRVVHDWATLKHHFLIGREKKEVVCNAAGECGFDCPHARRHIPFPTGDKMCTSESPCALWQRRPGIGEKKSRCRCVEVEK